MFQRFLVIQLGFVFLLSSTALYSFPDLNKANWQTVMFLIYGAMIAHVIYFIKKMDPKK